MTKFNKCNSNNHFDSLLWCVILPSSRGRHDDKRYMTS